LSHVQVIFAMIACSHGEQFLGTFAKLWRATISFFMSVHMEWLDSRWTDFHEILYWARFENLL